MKEFEIRDLSSEQTSFLNDYCPEDLRFTSKEEIEKIYENLNLGTLDAKDLIATRNAAVEFYSEKMDSEIATHHKRTERFDRLNRAMMSVTAVVDHFIVIVGGQI